MVEASVVGAGCGGQGGGGAGWEAALGGDPDVPAAGRGRFADQMRDVVGGKEGAECVAVVGRGLGFVDLGVEVEAEKPECALLVSESHAPGGTGRMRAEPVQVGVLVGVELAVGLADHDSYLVAGADLAGQLPGGVGIL